MRETSWNDDGRCLVTFLWFIIWFFSNLIGDDAPLRFDPVNGWAGTFLFALALDLAGVHAMRARR